MGGKARATRQRVVLVTGAGRGIGRAIARRFLEAGHAVALADVDLAALDDAVDEYRALGPAIAIAMDVSDEAAVERGVAAAARLGPLAAVINNAGIADPDSGPIEELAVAAWRRWLDASLGGAMLLGKHAAPHLRRAGGAIVNIASTRAYQSEKDSEAYAASKGGLVALTHALAISLGPEIRVNCVSPGWIDTSAYKPRGERAPARLRKIDHAQHPVGRVGRPEDIAALCVFLASEDAGFITGQDIIVDGGMTRKMIYAE